jgi:hypothetical protein
MVLAAVLVVLASAVAGEQAADAELALIEQRLARAWVDGDRATIDHIIADDWTTTDLTGRVRTKAEVMADMFANGTKPVAAMSIDDVRVRLLGTVAIVTGRTIARATGSTIDVVLRFTDVFVQRDGRWQVVASQGTRIAR